MDDSDLKFMVFEDDDGFIVRYLDSKGFDIWSEFYSSMSEVISAYADAIADGRFINPTI